jgi:DNA primase
MSVARTIRDVLSDAKIDAFVKTSGKSGIHVLAPWKERGDYDEAREWAMEIAQQVVGE